MGNKERYQSEKTKKLRSINKKIDKKATTIEVLFLIPIIVAGYRVISSMLESGTAIIKIILASCGFVSVAGIVSAILIEKYFENYKKNDKLIDKINIQEEYERLNEKEQDTVKQLVKDEELVDAIDYISDLEFNEERAELLKNVVLNKNVLNTMQVLDDKKCINALPEYDFDSIKLEQEYQNAIEIGTKPKSLKKTMNEIKKNFRGEK